MSGWPGKYVIGLTGNIATGKSVVRRMLEHLGAFGIDADVLAHRAIAPGAPGYQPVIDLFGKWIIAENGQIDRSRLARIVFNDQQALIRLEKIVHPLVEEAVDLLVRRSKHKVIVIEAIKLFEGELFNLCDCVWVTYSPEKIQVERLLRKRGMIEETAIQRIQAQPPQKEKVDKADQVIVNDGTYEETWQQVYTAWKKLFPNEDDLVSNQTTADGDWFVQRARPGKAAEIAQFIVKQDKSRAKLQVEDIMAAFGEKAFMLLIRKNQIHGLVGWKVENLVACLDDVYLDEDLHFLKGMRYLTEEIEETSKELQCEISLLFLPLKLSEHEKLLNQLGYHHRTIQSLDVNAWKEAAQENIQPGYEMFFKQLRQERVLRPM